MANKRFNIGLLVATITDEFSNRVARGAMKAAKQLDVNMVIFPGKYVGVQHINEQHDAKYEYQYNVLFGHAAEAKLDYLIVVVGTIAYAYDNKQKKEFLDSFGDTPVLSVASEIEGYDFLQFDNRSGVEAAVDYLAAHGRKRIGIMAGVLENNDCLQRYETYRKALDKNGLEFKDSYMMPCSLYEECREAAEEFVDKNPELDAIMCVNDTVASVVYEVLKERNIRIGIDVAVVGFDDQPIASRLFPPLASVRADAGLLGKRAVQKAVNYLKGIEDDRHYIKSKFIPRQSCYNYLGDMDIVEAVRCDGLMEMIGKVEDYLVGIDEGVSSDINIHDTVIELFEHLEKNYTGRTVDGEIFGETLERLDSLAKTTSDPGVGKMLNRAYLWLLRNCPVENIPYVEMLHDHFLADKNGETAESVTSKFTERSHIDNIFVRDTLMFRGSLKESYADIMRRLAYVGAMTGFIYIFDKPLIHRYGDSFPSDLTWYFKSYSYGGNVFTVPDGEQRMSAPRVFDNEYLCAERQHIFVVADLYTAETQYGIALLEPKDKEFFEELELVTYQLSSAVRTLDILKNQETLLEEINTRNLALDKMSKIDELTRVYNRRGFYPAAEALINDSQNQDKRFIVCYADMDKLKMVNDTYGHAEGDYSIKLVAECLAHVFGSDSIIGRMGGDEFAAIVPVSPDISAGLLKERKEQFIEAFNESKEKPYTFGVSMGVLECVCENSYDLRAAIDKADDLLYIEKSQKKRMEEG